ncbi:class I SAM-dependent DNA methyltransferase [Winogradskya humida]|nr:class I SAM-dependent methyltransferase [Actinoplanes humidus]
MDGDEWLADTRASYDTVAESYAELVGRALEGQPFLRAALGLFAGQVGSAGGGAVADVGCGPGHVTAYLRGLGVEAFGVDLSPGMVEVARRENPGVRFEVGSMTELALGDGSVAGVVAFWSLIHVPDEGVPGVFRQFRRVVRDGGPIMVGFHVGDGSRVKTQGYGGHPMKVHVHRRRPERVAAWMRDAGFTVHAEMRMGLDQGLPGAIVFGYAGRELLS